MNKKRIIFSSVCVLLVIALISGTWAWFYLNEEVVVGYGNSIFCEAGDSLEISLLKDGLPTRWSGTIDFSAGEFTTVDITGNGLNMYRPTEIDENQQPINLATAISSLDDEYSYDYIEMEVAFRSVSKMNVYLSEESFISPVDTTKTGNIYGNFSRDYIAGAMRVAIIEGNEIKMVWAPNSEYQLIQSANGAFSFKSSAESGSVPESDYYYYAKDENDNFVKTAVDSEAYASKKFVVDSTGTTKGYTGNSAAIVSLEPEGEGTHAQKTVKIRIWFEGTDREAHQALAGGNVNVKLKFIGIAKETDETKQAAVNRVSINQDTSKISGLAAGMVFSTDGRAWTEYVSSSTTLPVLESGESIYIKYPETETHYETNYKKLTKN